MRKLKFFAERVDFGRYIALHAIQPFGGKVGDLPDAVAQPVVFVERKPNEFIGEHDAMLRLRIEEAQSLMDELWQCGLRPSEGTGSAGALAATQKHLEDMQGIAIGLLRKDGVDL